MERTDSRGLPDVPDTIKKEDPVSDATPEIDEEDKNALEIDDDLDSSAENANIIVQEEAQQQGNVEEEKVSRTLESLQAQIDHFLLTFCLLDNEAERNTVQTNEEKGERSNEAEEERNDSKEEEESHQPSEQDERRRNDGCRAERVVAVDIPAFIENFLDLFMEELKKRDSQQGKGKWGQETEKDCTFLEALERVSKLNASFDALRSDQILGGLVNLTGDIQQRAMSYLEEEFRQILEEILLDHDSSDPKGKQLNDPQNQNDDETVKDDADEYFRYSEESILSVSKLADAMISGGFESECCQVYAVTRNQAFELTLSKTGFKKISIDEVQKMSWEALEREIPPWNMAFRECEMLVFSKEKELATSVFSKHPRMASSLFTNLARGVVIQLLNFAEAVAMTKRSAEKLFKLLDMYETLRDSVKVFEEIFTEEEAGEELKTETFSTRCRIGEAAICMFCDLENSIKSDTGKTPVPGGAVHPLSRYTMNYLKYACEYKATLEQVFKEHTKIERADSANRSRFEQDESSSGKDRHGVEVGASSPFAHQLIRIMDLLDSNLEGKSKLYRDMPLSCIFMMNNGRYILQKIKGSDEIHDAVGDTWCRKKSSDLRNYHNTYKRETWSKLLGCLAHEGLQSHNKVSKPVLKERFKGFNALFDEIHRTQASWVIHDEQLRSELRVSISAIVIPAYRSFLGRFSQYFTPGRQYEKYIKYQPEDIETAIDDLFDGNAGVSMARKRP